MRKLLIAALAMFGLTACNPIELHVYGARLRGAPVSVSYRGHPYYVTGGATYSFQQCADAFAMLEPQINGAIVWEACQVNNTWVWGSIGYTQNILDP